MSKDTVHNSTSLISWIDHSDIIFIESKKGGRIFYPFLSKILPLSICSFLCLHFQGFSLSLTQVDKFVVEFCTFYKSDNFSMQKKKAEPSPGSSPETVSFPGLSNRPKVLQFIKQFPLYSSSVSDAGNLPVVFSYWFKLKSRVSHDWVEDPLNGSY